MRLLFVSIFLSHSAFATGVGEYYYYQRGLSALNSEQPQMAVQEFLKALEYNPLNSKIHFAFGLALLAQEKPDQALKVFDIARKLSLNPKDRFNAAFNAGIAATQAQNVEEALAQYQDALEVDPQSHEVKTNIELLIKSQKQEGGGGNSDQKQQDQNQEGEQEQKKDGDSGQDQKEQNQPKPSEPEKKQPKKFESEELTPNDVNKILDELKSQEQGIRAKEYEKGKKSRTGGKDW